MSFEWHSNTGYLMILVIVCMSIVVVIATGWVIYEKCITTRALIDIETGPIDTSEIWQPKYNYNLHPDPETSAL